MINVGCLVMAKKAPRLHGTSIPALTFGSVTASSFHRASRQIGNKTTQITQATIYSSMATGLRIFISSCFLIRAPTTDLGRPFRSDGNPISDVSTSDREESSRRSRIARNHAGIQRDNCSVNWVRLFASTSEKGVVCVRLHLNSFPMTTEY